MKRSFVISDRFYRISHTLKRNRIAVAIYALCCLLFLVVGIAVGVSVSDKTAYVLNNGALVFKYLRGDSGIFSFIFIDITLSSVYCIFAVSMFFYKPLTFVSVVPAMYRAYVLGMNVSITVAVFSVSALPMLFVVFIPASIIEVIVLCFASARCFRFALQNKWCMPPKPDIKVYYRGLTSYIILFIGCTLAKAVTMVLFGSALIGAV